MAAACARNAQERCRRFVELPGLTPEQALAQVGARAVDLAQTRPEYNHATNAFCVVGRRRRTRGLFLDRRAFLVSYDPSADETGGALARLLAAVVPVVSGINLEYLFGTIDNPGYGAGTKLPHNVSGLIGVMDGAQSDLRTGLWKQTVEIHEAVRLTIVVECLPERLRDVMGGNPFLAQLVKNRWVYVACLDPGGTRLWEFAGDEVRLYQPQHPLVSVAGPSRNWFTTKRGHLPIVALRHERAGAVGA